MQRTLIIEDNQETLNSISETFSKNGIDVISCPTMDIAQSAIDNNIPFDFVILDWYFGLEGDSTFSKVLLSRLKGKRFRPVFVYAGTIQDYIETPDEEIDFPRNLMSGYSKVINPDELSEEINRKITENYSLQLAITYRNNIISHLEKVLFELNELQNVDIARILNIIFGDGSNVDWSSDLILNLLHRSLISDSDFIDNFTDILHAVATINEGISSDDRKKIANKILYFHSVSDVIRNGDIVKIVSQNESVLFYGIIVTPDCDLEQKKTLYIELIELKYINDASLGLTDGQKDNIRKFNHDSLYFFPSICISEEYKDFVAILKSKIILKEIVVNYNLKYPAASKRHLYSHEFYFGADTIRMIPLCSKANPYKAEFLQKLQTNNSRVGIPEIKNLF